MEFIAGNFHGRDLSDTVYVTASPILYRGLGQKYEVRFHDRIDVWAEDGWDEEYKTVLPETMTAYALEAAERYPNKRLVVHYIQPHYPFIGFQEFTDPVTVPDPAVIESDIWMLLMTGSLDVSRDRVWEAYRSNLDRAMPHIESLLENLTGKVVVTADHGNMVGERARPIPIREWGHPPGVYTPELVTVPWLEYEAGPRKSIHAEEPDVDESRSTVDDDVVVDRL
ncbi:MAG: hypothetical protein R3324_18300, partial [Halobacteriales archaeon]|nr:hypothetical protein [Halobacteriales archaeon]